MHAKKSNLMYFLILLACLMILPVSGNHLFGLQPEIEPGSLALGGTLTHNNGVYAVDEYKNLVHFQYGTYWTRVAVNTWGNDVVPGLRRHHQRLRI